MMEMCRPDGERADTQPAYRNSLSWSSTTTNLLILLLFASLSMPLLLTHEPWRDEAQTWLISRDSTSVGHFFRMMGYEGTPALWHVMLLPLARSGAPYVWMRLLHFALALGLVSVVVFRAPFPSYQRALLVIGYYLLYEYNIIGRSYVLSVLLLFLLATVHVRRFERPLLYSSLLALLANTNVHGLIIAAAFAAFYVAELLYRRIASRRQMCIAGLVVVASGLLVAVLQVIPPDDAAFAAGWHFAPRQLRVGADAVLNAFVPIPEPRLTFWNSRALHNSFVALPILVLSLCFLVKRPKLLAMYVVSAGGLLALFCFKYAGYMRHHGLIFVIFITCLWMAETDACRHRAASGVAKRHQAQWCLSAVLTLMLVAQIVGSSMAAHYDYNYEFSAGRRAAAFLRSGGFVNADTLVATYPSLCATSILPYLPRSFRFCQPEYDDFGSFMTWNTKWAENNTLPTDEIIRRVDRAAKKRGYTTVLLIMVPPVQATSSFRKIYSLIAAFGPTIVADESYCVFRLDPSKPASPTAGALK